MTNNTTAALTDEQRKAVEFAIELIENDRGDRTVTSRTLRALLTSPRAAVPEGWKLVPEKHTLDMSIAFAEAWFSRVRVIDDDDIQDAYSALLDAAPAAPVAISAGTEPNPSKESGQSEVVISARGFDAQAVAADGASTDEPRLDKPAQIGSTRFGKGVKWSTVIGAAQRHFDFMQNPDNEGRRMVNAVLGDANEPDAPKESPEQTMERLTREFDALPPLMKNALLAKQSGASPARIEALRKGLFHARDALHRTSEHPGIDAASKAGIRGWIADANRVLNGEGAERAAVSPATAEPCAHDYVRSDRVCTECGEKTATADERPATSDCDAKGLEMISGWLETNNLPELAESVRRLANERASRAAAPADAREPDAYMTLDCVSLKPASVYLDREEVADMRPDHVVPLYRGRLPADAGEAVAREPDGWHYRERVDGQWTEWKPCGKSTVERYQYASDMQFAPVYRVPAEAGKSVVRQVVINWAVERWTLEVKDRPLNNVNRRPLDDAWRQLIRYLGADDISLLGPRHDELAAARAQGAQGGKGGEA